MTAPQSGGSVMEARGDSDHPQMYSSISFDAESTPNDLAVAAASTTALPIPYWNSRDGKEILACLAFFVLCSLSPLLKSTNLRPIPFQLLSSGDYVKNLSYNENFNGDTVSDGLLVVLGMLLPLGIQFLVGCTLVQNGSSHNTACIYLVAFGVNNICTDLLKAYCGYLRPIFYALCNPTEGNYNSCNNNDMTARRSFPSGHASVSFCGLTLLSLFLHTSFGIPRLRREKLEQQQRQQYALGRDPASPLEKDPLRYRCASVLSLVPMGLALFIAASRVVDNRHFPADVVAGSLLGASIANFVHGLWL